MTDGYQADERLYHDGQGRWVSPDPAGLGAVDLTNPQTLNRYVYVMDDPLDNVDPSGLDANTGTICYTTSGVGQQGIIFQVTTTCAVYAASSPPPNTVGGQVIYAQAGYTGGAAGTASATNNSFKKIYLPQNANICFDNQNYFSAPPTFDIRKIEAAGKAGGWSPQAMSASVGHYGTFDFQRARDGAGNTTFYSGYTPVSNFAVGVYLYSAGFGKSVSSFIANTFAFFRSSNAGDPAQAKYRNLGYDTAARGQVPVCQSK